LVNSSRATRPFSIVQSQLQIKAASKIMTEKVFDNSGVTQLKVPGFGLPIDFELEHNYQKDSGTYFRHGINDFHGDRFTVRELSMLQFMETITEKPDWYKKVFDDTIVKKWKDEIFAQPNTLISEKAFEWCLTELRDKAKEFEEKRYVLTFDGPNALLKSDNYISKALQSTLKSATQPLLDDPKKDWHPNSNEQVLNLVHPSLYPLVYGRSQALKTGITGVKDFLNGYSQAETVPGDQQVRAEKTGMGYVRVQNRGLWSTNFQWLPCEVKFEGDSGTKVKITSYINNLHPIYNAELYPIIEEFVSLSIPLWNNLLFSDMDSSGLESLRIKTNKAEFDQAMPTWLSWSTRSEDPETIQKVEEYLALPDSSDAEDSDDDDFDPENWQNDYGAYGAVEWKWRRIRTVLHPEPDPSAYANWKKNKLPSADLETNFRKDGLQVIVKLASIELTPEKPDYPGGNWHLEGMSNEHIVATSIYYYDVENVTPARISFRSEAYLDDEDLAYEQNDHRPLEIIFGAPSLSQEPAIQDIGSTTTKDGRIIAFPNTLQHKVESFSLEDKTKPGHRRFLVLWLVDPHYRVFSTANVPPLRRDWWLDETLAAEGLSTKLPPELTKMITDGATEDWLMGEKEAEKLRLELMEERVIFSYTVERNFEQYFLCEH
jgi:Protein of unknown function (DUF4246)